jgi:hypothetical protein
VGLSGARWTLNEDDRQQLRILGGFSLRKALLDLLRSSTKCCTSFHSLQLSNVVTLLDVVYVGLESELQAVCDRRCTELAEDGAALGTTWRQSQQALTCQKWHNRSLLHSCCLRESTDWEMYRKQSGDTYTQKHNCTHTRV